MANSVTFPEALGGNGQTYTDDADPDTGLDGLGYTTRFIPCLQQAVVMGLSAQSNAQACADYVQQCQTLREEVGTDRQAVADNRTHVDQQKGLVDNAAGQVATDRQAVADDRSHVDQQKGLVDSAAQQVATNRQAVADDRTHVDQQKGLVDSAAQQVATDRQAVADDRLASQQAAGASSDAADASIQARNEAQALYGDLNAVETAKTQAQQAATDAREEKGLAQTAREGAENAQESAETAAGQSQQAVAEHEAKEDPHSQYEKKTVLKAGAYRDVEGGSGPVMAKGFAGLGATALPDMNLSSGQRHPASFGKADSRNGGIFGAQVVLINLPYVADRSVQFAAGISDGGRIKYRTQLVADEWTPVRTFYDTSNVLGPVSQSGGFPTGSLMERDSSDFGEWSVWANGYCEIIKNDITLVRAASNRYAYAWTLPKTFIKRAHASACIDFIGTNWDDQNSRSNISSIGVSSDKLGFANVELYVTAGYTIPADAEVRLVTAKVSGFLW